jgi:hypothetical protein
MRATREKGGYDSGVRGRKVMQQSWKMRCFPADHTWYAHTGMGRFNQPMCRLGNIARASSE